MASSSRINTKSVALHRRRPRAGSPNRGDPVRKAEVEVFVLRRRVLHSEQAKNEERLPESQPRPDVLRGVDSDDTHCLNPHVWVEFDKVLTLTRALRCEGCGWSIDVGDREYPDLVLRKKNIPKDCYEAMVLRIQNG